MKVADLYAALSIRPDAASFARARSELTGLTKRIAGVRGKMKGFLTGGGLGQYVGAYALGRVLKSAADDALEFNANLVDMEIASRHTVGPMGELRKEVLRVSNETGLAKDKVLAIARQFVSVTGDGAGAKKAMEGFAKAAVASKAPAEDVANAAAALSQQLNIQPEQMTRAFSIISQAGKLGKVELKDFAGLFATTGAEFKQFANSNSLRGLSSVASSLQFVAQNFGSPSEAAVGIDQLMLNIIRHATNLKKIGVDVYDKDPKTGVMHLKEFSKIIFEIANTKAAKSGNLTVLSKALGGRAQSSLALKALLDNKNAWFQMARQIEHANNVEEDFNERTQSASGKAVLSWNRVKNKITEAFTSERVQILSRALQYLATAAGKVIDVFQSVGNWLGETAAKLYLDWMKVADAINGAIQKVHDYFTGETEETRRMHRITQEEQRLIRGGMSPALAHDAAINRYGNHAQKVGNSSEAEYHRLLFEGVAEHRAIMGTGAMLTPAYYAGGPQAGLAAAQGNYTINVTVPPGSDAHGIGRIVQGYVQRAHDDMLRKAHAQVKGGQP